MVLPYHPARYDGLSGQIWPILAVLEGDAEEEGEWFSGWALRQIPVGGLPRQFWGGLQCALRMWLG